MKIELIAYKIKDAKTGKFASQHRGIDFVKGQGKSWSTKRGVLNAIIEALMGYCDCGNGVSPNDLRIVVLNGEGTGEYTIKGFCYVDELERIKTEYLKRTGRSNFYDTDICAKVRQTRDYNAEGKAQDEYIKTFAAEHDSDWYDLIKTDRFRAAV